MLTHIDLASDVWSLRPVDVEFSGSELMPDALDFGLRMTGDLDTDDADESGKTLAWCDHMVFSKEMSEEDRGLVFDSISIGGYSAFDHVLSLDRDSLRDYMSVMPRVPTWVVVWLGQNMSIDEWGVGLNQVYIDRIETIADRALEAAEWTSPGRQVGVVVVIPPQVSGGYPWARFDQIRDAMVTLATRRGWGVVDLLGEVGGALTGLNPGFSPDGIHPSIEGSEHVADIFYDRLGCWSADLNGDQTLNFFDVARFIDWFRTGDARADMDGAAGINFFDLAEYLTRFNEACGG